MVNFLVTWIKLTNVIVRSKNNAGRVVLALSAMVFVGGFAGLYLALRGLSVLLVLGWGFQAFFLLGIVVLLACAVAFGFLYLSLRWLLSEGLKICWVGTALIALGVLTFLRGDLPAFVTLEVAGALLMAGLASMRRVVVSGPKGGVSLRRSPLLLLALVATLLGVTLLVLANVIPAFFGYGGAPLLEGEEAYVPSALGYVRVGIKDVLKSVEINGSQLTLGLRGGLVTNGVVEEVVRKTVFAITKLGNAVLNLPELARHGVNVTVVLPPTPAPSVQGGPNPYPGAPQQEFHGPPPILYLIAKVSSLMNGLLGKLSLINVVSILFSLILIIYGLSVARGGGRE